jgi:hypothetical protein
MHTADGHGSSRGRREDQTKLTGDVDDEKLSQRSTEGETEVSTDDGQGDDTPEILLGGGEQLELVEGGNTTDEDVTETTGSSSDSLNNVVL